MSETVIPPEVAESKSLTPSTLYSSFNYFASPNEPQLNDISLLLGTSKETSSCLLPVTDLRPLPTPISSYDHETHGFQVLHQELPIDSSHASVHDREVMTKHYYRAMTSLLQKEFGIRSTAVVNHTLRDIASEDPRPEGGTSPFFISHTDYSAAGSRAHFRTITPAWIDPSQIKEERAEFFRLRDEIIAAEDLAITNAGLDPGDDDFKTGKGGHWEWDGTGYQGPRYCIFSVWRPWETVKRDPLALMNSPESDLRYAVLPRIYGDREGYVKGYYSENPLLRPPVAGEEEKHNWCYISEQKPEEVYTIKLYDSKALTQSDGSVKRQCPHSAFKLEGTENVPPRRSCELRMWCIW